MIEEMKIRYNCEDMCTENNHPGCSNKKNKCSCIEIVIAILAALFIGVLGVIIGAALSATILVALAAVIILAVVLFIALVISIIVAICCKSKNKKNCNCK